MKLVGFVKDVREEKVDFFFYINYIFKDLEFLKVKDKEMYFFC